uniref:Uncharacterized protein n=1 Tax=Oryza brachyantha TaxID=4533 RepID=J3MF41_ORYBR
MNNLRHRALASKKRPDSHSSSTSNTNGASSQRSVPSTNGTQVNPANSTAKGQNHESHRVTGTQDRQPPAQRGRKERSRTNLAVPRRGRKVGLIPRGEMQFKYVNYQAAEYKYTTQLGVILKREYPGTVEDLDNDGRIIRSRPALHWADYYLKRREGDGETCADRVINEFWEHDFGPEKTTGLNTFVVMKSGAKNMDSSGSHGPINNSKAEQIMADYSAITALETQEDLGGNELDPKALYTICNGLPHGRLHIGNDAVSKAAVIAAGKERIPRPSTSSSNQNLRNQNLQLMHENAQLQRRLQSNSRMFKFIFDKMGVEPPSEEDLMPPINEDLMSPMHHQLRTDSSHVGSHHEAQIDGTSGTNMDSEENLISELNTRLSHRF